MSLLQSPAIVLFHFLNSSADKLPTPADNGDVPPSHLLCRHPGPLLSIVGRA